MGAVPVRGSRRAASATERDGSGSSFTMVATPCPSRMVAPPGPERSRKKVSLGSASVSPWTLPGPVEGGGAVQHGRALRERDRPLHQGGGGRADGGGEGDGLPGLGRVGAGDEARLGGRALHDVRDAGTAAGQGGRPREDGLDG